jgi:hypothetical protein
MRFVLMDESTVATATPVLGGSISPEQLGALAAALMIQANRDVAFYWGGSHVVRAGSTTDAPQAGEVVCAIVDTLPDAPGDVAYHDDNGQELPVVFVSRAECTSILSGSGSISSAMSHEVCETIGDPACNRWADDGKGNLFALELCDATQEDSYEINGITLSNFLLPAFFASGSPGPFSFNGNAGHETVAGPFTLARGGYMVTEATSATRQVTGELGARATKARHYSSRVTRRGAIVP